MGLRPLLVAGGNDAVRPLFQGGEHGVDIGGLMGVVPVHDAHQVSVPSPLEEIPYGGVQHAPQVPVHLVGNHPHRGVFRRQAGDEGEGVVGTLVVHRHQLQEIAPGFQGGGLLQPKGREGLNVLRFIITGQVYNQLIHGRPSSPFS